jgi:hypothetical protein
MRQLSILGLYAILNSTVFGAESQQGLAKWPRFTEHQIEFNTDVLSASDLTLSDGSIAYRASDGTYELGLSLNHGYMDLSYLPNPVADLIGQANELSENRIGGQLYFNIPISKTIGWRLGAGFYDGYTNFRSLWLNEYYRQQFSNLKGYQEADPNGVNGLTGLRWEYLPATGVAELNLSYQVDQISPGYDRPLFQPLDRGRDRLKTGGLNISIEQVITPKLRGRLQYSLIDTTNRSLRQAAQVSLNYSIAESWVMRGSIARTSEQNGFRSHSIEGLIEHDWSNRWFLGLGARSYRDNGDIENSLFVVSTAAPDLKSSQAFVSLKWTNQRTSFRVEAGPYITDYAAPDSIVAPFAFLYSDRNFFRAGFSYTYSF